MQTRSLKKFLSISNDNRAFRWLLLLLTALVFGATFTSAILPVPYYSYQAGDVARDNIKSPEVFLIRDTNATRDKRQQASREILTVYDYNEQLTGQIRQRLARSFEFVRSAYTADKPLDSRTINDRVWEKKEKFENLIGFDVSQGAYRILVKEGFSEEIEHLIFKIVSEVLQNGVVANKDVLLKEKGTGIILKFVGSDNEEIVQNLRHFYGQDQAQAMVRIIGDPLLKGLDYTVKNLIVDFSQRLIRPNLILNTNETERRRKIAADNVKPVLYKIKKGEMILREGERVSEQDILKLEGLAERVKDKRSAWPAIGAFFMGIIVLLVIFLRNSESKRHSTLADNKTLLFFATMLCVSFVAARLSLMLAESFATGSSLISPENVFLVIPLATSAMIVCLFMDIELTASFALILALCVAAIYENSFQIFVYAILNMTMAAYWMQYCPERKIFIKAGVKLGLFNMAVVTTLNIYLAEIALLPMLVDCGLAFSGGVLTGILTAGLAPIFEMIFGYTTDIKLLELSNLDQPLLKRLMLEAPGTYHHSLIVGAMVEAAAPEVGANPLLARVCGYYHDIGKIKKPFYFIENQRGAKNKHEKLAPSMSSLILISHIKDGVEIARKSRLGDPIINAIRQHHGTRLISYFYEKAKRQMGANEKLADKEKEINVNDFRYPGPRPQSREAGLVMLADEVEAASRSLDSPTPSRIQKIMQDIINQAFSEGQLNECELTLKDLNNIAKSFNNILSGIYHHRIEYPAPTNGNKDNGSHDRQQTKSSSANRTDNSEKGSGRLKRLGQS
ncbi:MAG: HD family phosphohydrolase [Desulfosudaceae bacterium]